MRSELHVHFATTEEHVLEWDGTSSQPRITEMLDAGAEAEEYTTVTWSHGPLPDGTWSIRARKEAGHGSIVVRTELAGEIGETQLTADSENAFLPTDRCDGFSRKAAHPLVRLGRRTRCAPLHP